MSDAAVEVPATTTVAKEVVDGNGCSSEATIEDREAMLTSAKQLLATGKRNLLVSDLSAAVSTLAEASELFAKVYGETATECAEPYFIYGKALLELSRVEAGVIDNGLDGIPITDDEGETSQVEDPEKCTEEERETVSKEVGDALEENFVELEKAKAEKEKTATANGQSENGDKDGKEASEEKASDDNGDEKPADENDEGVGEEDGDDNGEEVEGEAEGDEATKDPKESSSMETEEEEPSNLQLSWEMLELAKNIFTKQLETLESDSADRSAIESKLSETYQLLGEVSIENENYKQAVEDLLTCLKRRQSHLPEDSRDIVATHYQLGVAQGFNLQFEEAEKSLNEAISVLEKRIQNLKNGTESKDLSKADDASYTREKEIEEIEKLIPEIREKIVDTNDMKAEALNKSSAEKEESKVESEETEITNGADKETSNISHLVKKRKNENGVNGVDTNGDTAKKAHIEEAAVNGNGVHANGNGVHANGH